MLLPFYRLKKCRNIGQNCLHISRKHLSGSYLFYKNMQIVDDLLLCSGPLHSPVCNPSLVSDYYDWLQALWPWKRQVGRIRICFFFQSLSSNWNEQKRVLIFLFCRLWLSRVSCKFIHIFGPMSVYVFLPCLKAHHQRCPISSQTDLHVEQGQNNHSTALVLWLPCWHRF